MGEGFFRDLTPIATIDRRVRLTYLPSPHLHLRQVQVSACFATFPIASGALRSGKGANRLMILLIFQVNALFQEALAFPLAENGRRVWKVIGSRYLTFSS